MKKLIFLFASIFVIWKFNIIDIVLNKYFEYKHNQNSSKITIYDDEFKSPTITISEDEDIVMPETTIKQYQANKEKLDSITILHTKPKVKRKSKPKKKYRCDGRTWCSQMTSCEEATFFSHNCSDTMDGNNDGVPCESQWCRR